MKNGTKKLLALALALAMVLSLVACSGSSDTAAETQSASGSTVAAAQDTSSDGTIDSLTVGVSGLWATLSPFQTTNNQIAPFVRLIYDRLAMLTPGGEYVPQAAKSWEVADDGVTYTVEIHDNIYDSAGNHITAADIVWYVEESISRGLKPAFKKIHSVSQTGDYTLEIVMNDDIVGAFDMLLFNIYAVSKDAFSASDDEFATTVVTSGPYTVKEFVSGSYLTLEKREDYWNADAESEYLQCNVNTITYQIITEASQQQIALETGTVDAFDGITQSLVADFEGNDSFSLSSTPGTVGVQIYFSGEDSRLVANDVNLRQAICHAIDCDGLITAVYDGWAVRQHDPATSALVGYLEKWDEEEYFTYDVELAQEYLAASDYNGEELVMAMSSGSSNERLGQMIQGYLAAVGINLKLNIMDSALLSATRYDGSTYDIIVQNVGGIILTNFWSQRFDMNSYELGDAQSRHDETLTQMIYDTWTHDSFTEENIDAIHQYIFENAYAYGLVNPMTVCVYREDLGITNVVTQFISSVDFAACSYS